MRRILTRGKQAVTCTSGRETETEEQTDLTRFSIASVPSNCELEIAPAQMCTSNRPLLHDNSRELLLGVVVFISVCRATLKDKTRSVQEVEIVERKKSMYVLRELDTMPPLSLAASLIGQRSIFPVEHESNICETFYRTAKTANKVSYNLSCRTDHKVSANADYRHFIFI